MAEAQELLNALTEWQKGAREPLFSALGYEPVGFAVPESALPDFGIDPAERPLTLELAARHHGFHVLRIVLRGRLDPPAIHRIALSLYQHNPSRRALLVFEARRDRRLLLASWGLGPGPFRLQKLWIDPAAPRRTELDILAALAVDGAATASDLALAHSRALDREEITRRFFVEFRRHRARLAASIEGVPADASQDRLDLALILLSRLLFLYFIQRKGWLAGDPAYLRHLYESALQAGVPFFRRRLKHLFFGALNRPPRLRSRAAQDLGELPYLNGGLFERDALERKHPRLDVADDCFAEIFHDLLDKYQFTLREDQTADQDVAVDPEMLGRVFEGLMAEPLRGSTGAFYTPRALVDQLVGGALSAHLAHAASCERALIDDLLGCESPEVDPTLRERLRDRIRSVRMLDPAVGSGAFLLAGLQYLERLLDAIDGRPPDAHARFERRKQVIQHNLHGVDINGAAVRLCELRLWLALVVDLEVRSIADVPPLPNLDVKIRQGDALLDPLDFLLQLGDLDHGALAGRWRKKAQRLAERRDRYFDSGGAGKRRLQRSLRRAERDLAVSFLGELSRQIDVRRRELRSAARSRDLFGKRSGLTSAQKKTARSLKRRKIEISRLLRRIRDIDELPFFSFPVHFADTTSSVTGFHVVVGNPPWVRPHHWSRLSRSRLRARFQSLRDAGWHAGSRLAGAGRGFGAQLDLSALFLERSLELLDEAGALGFLLPAKLMRGLSAAALRRRLLTTTRLLRIEDCALATGRIFDATTYPLSLLLIRGPAGPDHVVEVRLHDRRATTLDFRIPQARLPVIADDADSPWALAPPLVRDVLDRMRAAGPALGAQAGHRPIRGIFTGNNAVFVGKLADEYRADRVTLQLPGSKVEIEADRVRPALRGEDLAPWHFALSHSLVWTHDDDGRVLAKLPPALLRHLRKHERALRARVDLKPGSPYWTLFRVRPAKWQRRVAWRDIAPAPGAVVVPGTVAYLGATAPIISLNTVYQIAVASDEDAHLLAAVLNSTVARAYLRAIAERAAGGYFRFLGWTVALLPYPGPSDATAATECTALSRAAHAAGGLSESDRSRVDDAVAKLYGLTPLELDALREFDARLSNPGAPA